MTGRTTDSQVKSVPPFLTSNKIEPEVIDESTREIERNTYCTYPTILPTPDHWRPDFVPSIDTLKLKSYAAFKELHLFAIKHSMNSTLRTTFVFGPKLDPKEL